MPPQSATWAALVFVLTAIGAAYSYLAWRSKGLAAGVRGLAWTILPAAAWLTGTLQLAGRFIDAVTLWAASLVFNPLTWLGAILAGVSGVLFGASATMRRRGIGTRGRPAEKGPREKRTAKRPTNARLAGPSRRQAEPIVDDLDDIEAILKKHGIR